MENQENANVNAQNTEGQTAKPDNQQEKKLFTQSELDEIVKSRVNKEKEKYKEFDNYKKKATEYEVLRQENAEFKSRIEGYKEIEDSYSANYKELEASLTDIQKKLIPSEYSIVKKIKFINDLKAASVTEEPKETNSTTQPTLKFANAVLPGTQPVVKQGATKGIYGDGKYSTFEEYARNDPKGLLRELKANPNKFK